MKVKSKLQYLFFKAFPKKYIKFFNRYFDHKLSFNLLDLQKKGLRIDVIFDVGAYRGKWSKLLDQTSLKEKQFYLFEANEENSVFLEKLGYKFFISVLSDQKKEVKFFSNASTGDSYLVEQTSIYQKDLKPILKETTTLDILIEKENLPLPDFLKVDTQGSELDILKGSKKSLTNCSLIYLECPIIEYNLGAPNFTEYVNYMKTIDYMPYEICEVHNVDKALVQIDILFLKTSILKKINHNKKILNIFN